MTEDYNKEGPIEKRYLEIEHYGVKESMKILDNINYKDGHKILAKRGRDDRPQEDNSKKKVKALNKRRIIRKNLNDLI
jgi:hypothetical protein